MSSSRPLWRDEWPLLIVWASALAWLLQGKAWIDGLSSLLGAASFLIWVCLAILLSAFAVVRHADVLAERFGEPYGTMILTFAVNVMAQWIVRRLSLRY